MSLPLPSARTGTDTQSATPAASPRKFQRLGVIIGAMKAGTTSLFHTLARHPEIAPSNIKETHFFKTAASASAGLEAYEAYWSFDPTRHAIALEASPSYSRFLKNPGVPERLAATPYDLRLVYVLRNPVARYVSNYVMALAQGYEMRDIHRDLDPNALNTSCYAAQLAAYTAQMSREKILLVRFEDLASSPKAQLDRIAGHFGVTKGVVTAMPHLHASAQHHLANAVGTLTSDGAKAEGQYGRPAVTADGRIDLRQTFFPAAAAERLRAALRDDMRRLHEEWGFDVKPWGF